MADMRKFTGGRFIKFDAVEGGRTLEKVIKEVTFGEKFGRPDLNFDDDTALSLNATNTNLLIAAMGENNNDWIGKKVELSGGKVPYNGTLVNSVTVKPLEEVAFEDRTPLDDKPLKNTPVQQAPHNDMDDEIPF
jgi:hypothetical protein